MDDVVKQTIEDFKKYIFKDGLTYSEAKERNEIVSFSVFLRDGDVRPSVDVTFTPSKKVNFVYRENVMDGGDFGVFAKYSDKVYEAFPEVFHYEVLFEYFSAGSMVDRKYETYHFLQDIEDIQYHEWLQVIENESGIGVYEQFFQDN